MEELMLFLAADGFINNDVIELIGEELRAPDAIIDNPRERRNRPRNVNFFETANQNLFKAKFILLLLTNMSI